MRARAKSRRAGQSLVEFAFTVIIFLNLVLGTINLAYGVYCYHTIAYAARDAVRYAIVRGPNSALPATTAQIQQTAVDAAIGVNLALSNVTVSWPTDASLATHKDVKVTVALNYPLLLTPASMTLSSTSQMMASQ